MIREIFMRRLILLFSMMLVACVLVACNKPAISKELTIEIGESTKFTEEEILEAIDLVRKDFNFPAATLTKIWYDEEISNSLITVYLKNGRGAVNGVESENVLILLSEFYVDRSGENPVLNSDSIYTDFQWILIRDINSSNWIIDDWGY